MINLVNRMISKAFARFLKENNVYMDYVRNVIDYCVSLNFKPDASYFEKDPLKYLSHAFVWGNAKYPSYIGNNDVCSNNVCSMEKHKFWENINKEWLSLCRSKSKNI